MKQTTKVVGLIDKDEAVRSYVLLKLLLKEEIRTILSILIENPGATVTEINRHFPEWEQPVVSQQMALLRRQKVVYCERIGKHRPYYLNHDRIEQVRTALSNFSNNIP